MNQPIRQLTVHGTPRQVGQQIGQAFTGDIHRIIGASGVSKTIREHRQVIEEVLGRTEQRFPAVVDELRGLAEGAGLPFQNVFTFNCPEIRGVGHGCSSYVVRRSDGTFLLGHNEDGSQAQSVNELALITVETGSGRLTALIYLGELLGNAASWNSHGLVVTVNDLHPARVDVTKIPRYFVARAVAQAPTIDEAVDVICGTQAASGFHYLIGSVVIGEVVSIESTGSECSPIAVDRSYCHTNHFIHPRLAHQPSQAGPSSQVRLTRLGTLVGDPSVDPVSILGDRDDRPYSIYAREDVNRTLVTVVCDTQDQSVRVWSGGVDDPQPVRLLL